MSEILTINNLNSSDANKDKTVTEDERTNIINVAQLHVSTWFAHMLMNMAFLIL